MLPLLRIFLHSGHFWLCSFTGATPPYAFACSCFSKKKGWSKLWLIATWNNHDRSCNGFHAIAFYMLMLMLWCYICSIGLFCHHQNLSRFLLAPKCHMVYHVVYKIKEQSQCAEFVENPIFDSERWRLHRPLLLPDQVRESLSKDSSLTAAISDSGVFVLGSCQLSGMWQLCCWKILMGKGKKCCLRLGGDMLVKWRFRLKESKNTKFPMT